MVSADMGPFEEVSHEQYEKEKADRLRYSPFYKNITTGEVRLRHSGEIVESPEQWSKATLEEYDAYTTEVAKTRICDEENFKYDTKKPATSIRKLSELQEIICKHFPTIWFEFKACLSTIASLGLKNLGGCPALVVVGNPSGEKTTLASFFYGHEITYLSDEFTPRAFVSHAANIPKKALEKIDLLPRIRNKALITPELAPIFEAPKERLIDDFATLTRVLDGEGYNSDKGTHGHRGYSGDYKFAWIGASTPLRASVWRLMGKIGNRLFFISLREKNRNDKDYLEMFRGQSYDDRIKECRGAVHSFLNNLFGIIPKRSVIWDAEGDIFILPEIIKYAKFLAKLRASLMTWKSEEKGQYEYSFPIIEEPPRAINSLYNFAKGHALINGRRYLKQEDLDIVKAICFSSMPHDRYEFLKLLAKHEGKLTTRQIESELNCSPDTAQRTMNIFQILGIVTIKSIDIDDRGSGRPMQYIEILPEFSELLRQTQGGFCAVNNKPQEKPGVCDGYDALNPREIIKNNTKNSQTHSGSVAVNNKPQEIPPVSEEYVEDDMQNPVVEEVIK